MSDLTDERIAELVQRTAVARHVDERAAHAALLELQRHRAAQAADEERVRRVVSCAVRDALLVTEWRTLNRVGVTNAADVDPLADAIATRAAKQLASAASGELPLWAKFAIQKMHDMVDQTDPDDPIGIALTHAGLERRPE